MNNEKTIKQLADELGVSKQAIQKRINNLPDNQQPIKVGGKYVLSQELVIKIRSFYANPSNADNQSKSTSANIGDNHNVSIDLVINDLKMDKKQLQSELSIKNNQIEKLQKLLDQQQILTLQANKKIEELELKNNESERQKKENDFSFKKDQEEKQEQKVEESSAKKNMTGVSEKKNLWARWFKK